jgi:hypothetical protein
MVGKVDCTGSRRRPSHDLFGFVDLIGFDQDLLIQAMPIGRMELHCVLIQLTDGTSHSKHRKKILASKRAREIEERDFPDSLRVELISWRLKGRVYVPRVEAMRPLVREVLREEALSGE